jgi:DNA-binding NarL/FixJ family response regulator
VPVVFFSAADDVALRSAVVESGVAGCIHKRALTGELVDAVGRYLGT